MAVMPNKRLTNSMKIESRLQRSPASVFPKKCSPLWSFDGSSTSTSEHRYPITPLGKLLAGCTAIVGVGLIATPTGILSAAFSEVFQCHREAQRDWAEKEV